MASIGEIKRKNGTSVFQVYFPNEIVENTLITKGRVANFEVISEKEIKITLGD